MQKEKDNLVRAMQRSGAQNYLSEHTEPMQSESPDVCPCQSGLSYAMCCELVHLDPCRAATPVQLMRSRYSAYVLCNETHLLNTWHPITRPSNISFDPNQKWLGLRVKREEADLVEFVARFKIQGRGHRLHETSRFEKIDGQWFYLDGELHER